MNIEQQKRAEKFYVESNIEGIHSPKTNKVELNYLDLTKLMHNYSLHKENSCNLIEKNFHLNYAEIVAARGVQKGDKIYLHEWQEFIVQEERPEQSIFALSYNEDGSIASSSVMSFSAFTYKVSAEFRFDYS